MKFKLKGRRFEEIQAESQRVLDTLTEKWLPGSVPKMGETVVPVSTCGSEPRGWCRPIGIMVSFMIFTASVRNILATPSYLFPVINLFLWLSKPVIC
jgi:hypothetical protein